MTNQIMQNPDFGRRNEAGAHQPVADQIGNPLGILHVGLTSRHVAHVRSITNDDDKAGLQHLLDGLPVHARRLHADMGYSHLDQPVAQTRQIPPHGIERSHLP